jgi:hypothetical protein
MLASNNGLEMCESLSYILTFASKHIVNMKLTFLISPPSLANSSSIKFRFTSVSFWHVYYATHSFLLLICGYHPTDLSITHFATLLHATYINSSLTISGTEKREKTDRAEVVRDTAFKGQRNYIAGFQGSHAVPTRPSLVGEAIANLCG